MVLYESERLQIGSFSPGDAPAHYRLRNSHECQLYNCERYEPFSERQLAEEFEYLLSQDHEKKEIRYILALHLKEGGDYIGYLGFKNGVLTRNGSVEIYYALDKKYWNRGLGTELVRSTIRFCFEQLQLHRIFAGCDADNVASERVMQKAGMTKESTWRKDRLRNGVWKDGHGYSILEEDYAERSGLFEDI